MSENKFIVTMNGQDFATFKTEAEAKAYAIMQKCKIKGAGLALSPDLVPEAKKSFASKQNWGGVKQK